MLAETGFHETKGIHWSWFVAVLRDVCLHYMMSIGENTHLFRTSHGSGTRRSVCTACD